MRLEKRFLALALATALATLTTSGAATAQCPPIADGLSGGPCCAPAQPVFPAIPDFQQDALNICWRDCDVDNILGCRVEWKRLAASPFTACRMYSHRIKLRDPASGVVKWRGRMRTRYSRTWEETTAAGETLQVWRYLLNGDLGPTAAAGPVPCPVPPCAPVHNNRVRFTGYIDYARNCATGQEEFAWMLTHACDAIDHAPGFQRGGTFHPDYSYTFVGPAAGFLVGPIQPVEAGTSTLEAVRRIARIPGTVVDTCEFEEPIQHSMNPLQQLCLCGPVAATPQWVISDLGLGGACGTAIFTPGGPFLPGFMSMGIGSWTDPTRFPGEEILRYNAGNYDYFDPCNGVTRSEVFFGVTTLGGFPAQQIPHPGGPALPLPEIFVDQNNSLGVGGTIMNVAFRSDHILNLNY